MDISVVIPFYNEEESLMELNDWIFRVMQSNHFSFELIYVDDGSGDGSWAVVEQLASQHPEIKAIRFRRNYGKSAALNEGFKKIKGRVGGVFEKLNKKEINSLIKIHQKIAVILKNK